MERAGACVLRVDEGQMGGLPIPEQHCSSAKGGPGQQTLATYAVQLCHPHYSLVIR